MLTRMVARRGGRYRLLGVAGGACLASALAGCGGGGGGNNNNQNAPAATVELSIAAGETSEDSVLLWARVTVAGDVVFEISETDDFAAIVDDATVAVTDPTIPAKALFDGSLDSGTTYFYRVTDPVGQQAVGTFRTYNTAINPTRFGVTGDWRGELAPYPGVRNIPDQSLDFLVTLGDSIYADSASPFVPKPALPEEQFRAVGASTLEEFRLKHAEVYSRRFGLNTLADVRAATTWYATIDDHEVFDNHAGGAPFNEAGTDTDSGFPLAPFQGVDDRFAFIAPAGPIRYNNQTPIFANGLQAFTEYHPIDGTTYATTTASGVANPLAALDPDPRLAGQSKLYRTWQQGNSAFFLLDTRSFRSAPVAEVTTFAQANVLQFVGAAASTTDSHIPAEPRTLLGIPQLRDLIADLQAAEAAGVTWKFVFTSVVMQSGGPIANGEDRWDGYLFERTALLVRIATGLDITGGGLGGNGDAIDNVVFVTADIHGTISNNITFNDPNNGNALTAVPTCWEISTGSVGFSPPLGVSLVDIGTRAGLLAADQRAIYDSLPRLDQKDGFVKQVLNGAVDLLGGFDRLGIDSEFLPLGATSTSALTTSIDFINAPDAVGGDVIVGDHAAAVHYFGWTQFEVDDSEILTVTTFGVDGYTDAELIADPAGVTSRQPRILQQFRVRPGTIPE